MLRREMLVLGAVALPAVLPLAAHAHHGWSSFDQDRPIWLEGEATKVQWRNPHAEVMLRVPADLRVPPDLGSRAWPAQSASVDGAGLARRAVVPTRKDRDWEVELAPISRMDAWKVPEVRVGQRLAVLGFTMVGEKGDAVLRAEYLVLDGKVYGLRSSPA